ncbi:HAD family hydrolase, partial [Bifidobacterium pseudocatenulatum]|nr:HAD family hydrolase [Bifidobacterium pseudocatenulatum]
GIGSAAKRGMIAKGSAALDELTKIDTFVFDKTGTLTTGQPSVGKVVNVNGDQNKNLKILVSIEHESNHPLAKAILDYWQKDDVYTVSDSQIIDWRG